MKAQGLWVIVGVACCDVLRHAVVYQKAFFTCWVDVVACL